MEDTEYKYDVAFSFLAKDEKLAAEINDLLQDRVLTFLYSKKQEAVAATDGEKTFNKVFGEEARLVVVLYRTGWGQTPWTRIEETAIRNRAYDHGYDFVKFIPLDDPPNVPEWLPRTHIWIGLSRYGAVGAASVIEARVEELGGEPHEESVADRASRLERSLRFSERRRRFLNSEEGVRAANEEFEVLYKEFERLTTEINESASSLSFSITRSHNVIIIVGSIPSLRIAWNYHYANNLEASYLNVSLWHGNPPFPRSVQPSESTKLSDENYTFDLLPNDQRCWVSPGPHGKPYSSLELASFLLKYSMDQTATHQDRR